MEKVNLILRGHVAPGTDPAKAAADFARLCGLDEARTLEVISSGKPCLAGRGLSIKNGQAWLAKLQKIGIEARLEPETGQSEQKPPAPVRKTEPPPDKAGSAPEHSAEPEENFNPYAAPKVDLSQRPAQRQAGSWRNTGRKVAAGHGWNWLRDSFKLFGERPGAWIGASLLLCFFSTIVPWGLASLGLFLAGGSISPLGINALSFGWQLIFFILAPLLCGGVSLMAHRQMAGEPVRALDLFSGFKSPRRGALLKIALWEMVFYLAFFVLCGALLFLCITFFQKEFTTLTPLIVYAVIGLTGGAALFCLCIGTAFAPGLAALAGGKALPAIIRGMRYGLANWLALLICGLIIVLLLIPGSLVIWLFMAIFPLVQYMACRDIFYEDEKNAQEAQTSGCGCGLALVAALVIGGFIVIALLGIVAAIVIPQYKQYRLRAVNAIALADLRNAATNQQDLLATAYAFGTSAQGPLPGSGAGGTGQELTGPLPAPILTAADKDGKAQGRNIGVSKDVYFRADTDMSGKSFLLCSRYNTSGTVYAMDSDSGIVYVCKNDKWAFQPGIMAKTGSPRAGRDDLNGADCGGSPVGIWQPQ